MLDDAGTADDTAMSEQRTVAGRYRIGAELGRGAGATVSRAVDLRLGRDVALKVFHPGQDPQVRSRFAAEAVALARLSHPGLVSIFDAGVAAGGRMFLVMQYVDGESLRVRLADGPLSPAETAAAGTRLASALAHVHANGIVHRDVKPSNIVLDAEGLPYLADFGIALLVDGARMTGSNEIVGTAAYLAPEQILGDEVGAPADVYSLGLVLLECLSGELEYPAASKVESALARLLRPPRVPDGLPGGLGALLGRMTAQSPRDRPTAAECAERLAEVAAGPVGSARPAVLVASRAGVPAPVSTPGEPAPEPSAALVAATTIDPRMLMPLPVWHPPRHRLGGWRSATVALASLAGAVVVAGWMFETLLPAMESATAGPDRATTGVGTHVGPLGGPNRTVPTMLGTAGPGSDFEPVQGVNLTGMSVLDTGGGGGQTFSVPSGAAAVGSGVGSGSVSASDAASSTSTDTTGASLQFGTAPSTTTTTTSTATPTAPATTTGHGKGRGGGNGNGNGGGTVTPATGTEPAATESTGANTSSPASPAPASKSSEPPSSSSATAIPKSAPGPSPSPL